MRFAGEGDRLAGLYRAFAALDLGREIVMLAQPAGDAEPAS
ncbi:MAG: hypothetical protein R3F55_19725 [Alphaproteobacteria bacterium]